MTQVLELTPAELADLDDAAKAIGFVGCECGVFAQAPIAGAELNDWDELNRWYLRHAATHDEEAPQ